MKMRSKIAGARLETPQGFARQITEASPWDTAPHYLVLSSETPSTSARQPPNLACSDFIKFSDPSR